MIIVNHARSGISFPLFRDNEIHSESEPLAALKNGKEGRIENELRRPDDPLEIIWELPEIMNVGNIEDLEEGDEVEEMKRRLSKKFIVRQIVAHEKALTFEQLIEVVQLCSKNYERGVCHDAKTKDS